MGWFRVTKRINGRQYHYWQRSYRSGGKVRTENVYVGPASAAIGGGRSPTTISQYDLTTSEHRRLLEITAANAKPSEPRNPIEDPPIDWSEYSKEEKNEILAEMRAQTRRYNIAMKKQKAAVRKARREAKGTGAKNAFLGRAINRLSDK